MNAEAAISPSLGDTRANPVPAGVITVSAISTPGTPSGTPQPPDRPPWVSKIAPDPAIWKYRNVSGATGEPPKEARVSTALHGEGRGT